MFIGRGTNDAPANYLMSIRIILNSNYYENSISDELPASLPIRWKSASSHLYSYAFPNFVVQSSICPNILSSESIFVTKRSSFSAYVDYRSNKSPLLDGPILICNSQEAKT